MAKGFPGNMQGLLKQAEQMQKNLLKAKEEAEKLTAEGVAGGGMVKATANGKNELISLEISNEVVDPNDIEMLQDLIIVACNEALKKVQEKVESEISKVTGGMNLPF